MYSYVVMQDEVFSVVGITSNVTNKLNDVSHNCMKQ